MEATHTVPHERVVGPDRLKVEGEHASIDARRAMPDWTVGRFRPVSVVLPEGRFALREAHPGRGGRVRYELSLWGPLDGDRPAREIHYDDVYVEARERNHRTAIGAHAGAWFLAPAWPLIGLLPSPIKRGLSEALGLDAEGATRASLWLQAVALLFCFTVLTIHWMTGTKLTADLDGTGWFVGLGLVDWIARRGLLDAEPSRPVGLLEWLWPGHWRRGDE